MANYDSKSSTSKDRVTRIYSDLDLDFMRNHTTSDLTKLEDVEAVIGSDVRALLFENMTPLTALNLERKVQEVLQNFEPRAKISSVIAEPIEDRNAYHLQISFYVVGIQTPVVVETFLQRLR